MADDKDTLETPEADDAPAKKKASTKKSPPKATGYVVAPGRSIAAGSRVIGPGGSITADEVADIEALIKGGFVLRA